MKKNTLKTILLISALILILTPMFSCGGSSYTDGSYIGSGTGHHGEIKVKVTIKSGNISSIEVIENPENKVLSKSVYDSLIGTIIKTGSADVDGITGASDTSRGFIEAVKSALVQSNPKAKAKAVAEKKSEPKEKSEQNFDVVVIGAGGAGLTAGVAAAEAGVNVVVLEKMPAPGGNTLISGGGLNVPGSWMQEKHGISDSVEKYTADTLKGGDFEGEETLVKTLAENAVGASEWLRDEIGLVFLDRVQQFGGHSVPRALIPEGNSGEQMILKLMKKGESLGMILKTGTEAIELITGDNGAVTGVKAKTSSGQQIVFNASKGVIIATGGFGSNLEMRMKYNPEYDEEYMSTCLPQITGDGINMAVKVGAGLTDMNYIQTYPTCNPVTGIISYVANSRFYGAVLVNKEGKRFINEMGRRDKVSRAILDQSGKTAYLFWDSSVEGKSKMIEMHPEEYDQLVKNKLIVKADTISEAAAFFGIDADTLAATAEAYTKMSAAGKDADFGRGGKLATIAKGPFYLQKVVPSVHHTMGGLMINTSAEVLDENGNPIQGLFAAGETTGGIHGTNRLGGNAITDLTVFGRIAGKNAASK